jgi:hypothetical protein
MRRFDVPCAASKRASTPSSNYSATPMTKNRQQKYQVERDCCTSGHCFHCARQSPYGTPVRVLQFETDDFARAQEVATNWRAFNAAVVGV